MEIIETLNRPEGRLVVIGLGYVGMPLAIAFSEHFHVVGFDINEEKIKQYRQGHDMTGEVGDVRLKEADLVFTSDVEDIQNADLYIISVPTPINGDKTLDLTPVIKATELVGRALKKGSIVVYESTVYPGVTEDICRPVLEKMSHLSCGPDFKIAYSPERINPGDKVHRLDTITKIVSGIDEETVEAVAAVYSTIIKAGVYQAPSIKVAEAAKLVENSQRDINIAILNEFAIVFNRMGIETREVIKAMNTKWNALHFYPGLVGGHCIGIDPYYFINRAEQLGYHSQVVSAGRRINDSMSDFVTRHTIRLMLQSKQDICRSRIYLMGITFKENCPDVRNSRPYDVYTQLTRYGITPYVVDPVADEDDLRNLYGLELTPLENVHDADCLIFLVNHDAFRHLSVQMLKHMYRKADTRQKQVLIDVKGMYPTAVMEEAGYCYWCL